MIPTYQHSTGIVVKRKFAKFDIIHKYSMIFYMAGWNAAVYRFDFIMLVFDVG